ncbi:ABC-three component system middle component 8 [Acinetobacter pittii]|uniref:ABC-three component system middle component 8 n=1 Tax=Acinetobacter pittii TaxID=48296 RepID=UPI003B50C379
MILPTKHSHPDQTALFASTIILKHLLSQRIMPFEDIKKIIYEQIVGGEFVLMPALSILYLLGTIKYHIKTDTIEYLAT